MLDDILSLMFLLNKFVATGTIFLELLILLILADLFFLSKKNVESFPGQISNFAKTFYSPKNVLYIIFIFSLSSSILTLVYSEIFMQIPCALCWFERVFMYGTVLVSTTALWSRREPEQKEILKYILNFSVLGTAFSLYHHILQMSAASGSTLPCPASGGDCAKRIIFEYGHITFPWMAFIMFVFFIVLILISRKINK